jgi:hypothetical protein
MRYAKTAARFGGSSRFIYDNFWPGAILSYIKVTVIKKIDRLIGLPLLLCSMKEDEKSPDQRIRESTAEGCVCPDCGHDVQPSDIYVEIAHSIGETYWHPACPECNVYCNSYDNSHWYPNE